MYKFGILYKKIFNKYNYILLITGDLLGGFDAGEPFILALDVDGDGAGMSGCCIISVFAFSIFSLGVLAGGSGGDGPGVGGVWFDWFIIVCDCSGFAKANKVSVYM